MLQLPIQLSTRHSELHQRVGLITVGAATATMQAPTDLISSSVQLLIQVPTGTVGPFCLDSVLAI